MTSSKYQEEKMPNPKNSKEIMNRKIEHLKIPLEYNVQHSENYFNDINLKFCINL